MQEEDKRLAIVIPAFKASFFYESLNSLYLQTDNNFTVYVGDDASPENIKAIVDSFAHKLKIVYYRFTKNLGKTDLVAHWHRCVNLIKGEKWIWLFSDDDLAESSCVSKFFQTLDKTNGFYDVYRFNTTVIDAEGKFMSASAPSPLIEDSYNLAYNILLGNRGNAMPDHIFKKEKYYELNGFVNFIQAQASDWATSINFATPNGLYTIPGPKVMWRFSGKNISSIAYVNKVKLIFGHLQFISWVLKRFDKVNTNKDNFEQIRYASKINLELIAINHYHGIPFSKSIKIATIISNMFNQSIGKSLFFCFKINFKVFYAKRVSPINFFLYQSLRKVTIYI